MTKLRSSPAPSVGRSQGTPRARDGAAVGLAFGLAALAIGLISGEIWLAAAVPAGLVAGSVSAPLIVVDGRIRRRGVFLAALLATLVGDAAIALGMSLDHPQPIRDAPDVLATFAAVWTFGLISAGWLALPPLVAIACLGGVVIRRRVRNLSARDRSQAPASGSAWLAGLVVGVGAGVLSLSIPVVGWTIGLAFLAGALMSRAVGAGIGGFLVGAGAAWLAILVESDARCRAFNGPGRECISPDLAPWLAVGLAMVLVGAVATAIAARRQGRVRTRRCRPRLPR